MAARGRGLERVGASRSCVVGQRPSARATRLASRSSATNTRTPRWRQLSAIPGRCGRYGRKHRNSDSPSPAATAEPHHRPERRGLASDAVEQIDTADGSSREGVGGSTRDDLRVSVRRDLGVSREVCTTGHLGCPPSLTGVAHPH